VVYVSEIGASERDGNVIVELLSAVAQEAKQQGMGYGQLALPHDPQIDTALERLFGQTPAEQTEAGTVMMRALKPNGQHELEAAVAAPESIFWEIDRY
jgi:hypothetical protein